MANQIWKNAKLYVNGIDLSGDMNSMGLTHSAELQDATVYGSSFKKRKPGLIDTQVTGAGFWNSSEGLYGTTRNKPDPTIFRDVGSTGLVDILPHSTDLGGTAYMFDGLIGDYSPGGAVGEMFKFSFTANSKSKTGRGKLLMRGILSTNWGGVNTSTGQNLGVATTDKSVITDVHILGSSGAAGAAMTVRIQASTVADFSGTPKVLHTISLTTANVGKAVRHTTANPSTSYSYVRAKTSQAGTSLKRFKAIVTVGYK